MLRPWQVSIRFTRIVPVYDGVIARWGHVKGKEKFRSIGMEERKFFLSCTCIIHPAAMYVVK